MSSLAPAPAITMTRSRARAQADSKAQADPQPFVLDVSRLIWRLWAGRLPTGIDRVCLAYLEEFADRALAMLQWREHRVVLGPRASRKLFSLLLGGVGKPIRRALAARLAAAIPLAIARPPRVAGKIYLNVGHTGLNVVGLVDWLAERNLRPVFLIHDLIPITHPQYCRAGEAERHAARMRNALAAAAGFIVNSADTGAELTRFAHAEGREPAPILVAHLGIEPLSASKVGETQAVPAKRPYFLCLGTIEARKNHILLLQVWDALRERLGTATPDLILIGQRGWEAEQTFELLDTRHHDQGRIIELPRCTDGELAAWLDGARALLMPSHVEGYGLPVLEALSRATPVIATDLPVYRELAPGIPMLLPADDREAWENAVLACIDDSGERTRQKSLLVGYRAPDWAGHMTLVKTWLDGLPS
ncbi:glycosyltransferase family 1 protein [Novosphingobium sp.]|uniref:glycosyltransferase family 4 protein n=1 Tax=Novosphingobium sp. TaxID=1874826 RepID=UPI0028A8E2E5|nr:glycosyltransferase family 1 protein [Novosphingobium sp.]